MCCLRETGGETVLQMQIGGGGEAAGPTYSDLIDSLAVVLWEDVPGAVVEGSQTIL